MENDEQQPPPPAAGAPPAIGQIKLPAFWPEDPASWFRLAEGQFALRNVADPVTRYYHVLAALSVDSVRLVRHVLHDDTGPESYDRKPSVMLAEMLEYCPTGESTTAVFAFLCLQRLPREIRVLLSEDDPANMRAIAEKADRLIAMHVPQSHDTCAAVAADDLSEDADLVATLQGARSRKDKGSKRPQQIPHQQKELGRRIDLAKKGPAAERPFRTSMCHYHAKFGERARHCQEGCTWPEN